MYSGPSEPGDTPEGDPSAASNVPDLEIVDVSKTFTRDGQRVDALRNVSLTVRAGEFMTILGPSGCGKSTLLHIIGGFVRATNGEVRIGERTVTGPGTDRGMVFQDAMLFPWKTVLRNVAWPFEIAKRPRREARQEAEALLKLVGLEGFEDAYPAELSGGMRQRAALARTLGLGPKMLLMDEPFGALDAQTREFMQEELNRIWEDSRLTVCFITHDIHEAIFLGDRVAVMTARPGEIKQIVDIDLPRPRDPSVKKSTEMVEYHGRLWDLLREESNPPMASGDARPA